MHLSRSGGGACLALAVLTATAAAAPSAVTPPAVSGDARYGGTLKCAPGTWAGSPTAFVYEWMYNGSARATGPTLRVTDPYLRTGFPVTCRVTATDGAGAATAAESAGVVVQPGVSRIQITSVKTLSRGRIVIRGRILPRIAPPLVGLLERGAGVVMVRKVGPSTVTPLGQVVAPDAKGFFTVRGTDTAGTKRIRVHFDSANLSLWASADATRRVVVTPGGRTGRGDVVIR